VVSTGMDMAWGEEAYEVESMSFMLADNGLESLQRTSLVDPIVVLGLQFRAEESRRPTFSVGRRNRSRFVSRCRARELKCKNVYFVLLLGLV
jgi:hypothetical protein